MCEAMGECPATTCETEGETMAYDDPAECTNMYCTCTAGVWEETVSAKIYNSTLIIS